MQKKYFEIKTNYDKFDLTAKGLEKIINQNFNQSIVKVKEIKPKVQSTIIGEMIPSY